VASKTPFKLEKEEIISRKILNLFEAPGGKQRGIFDPKGEKSIHIRASNPRPQGWGMRRAVRVQRCFPKENSFLKFFHAFKKPF